LQDPLANAILEGRIADGQTVTVTVEDGALSLNGTPVEADVLAPGPLGSDGKGEGPRVVH